MPRAVSLKAADRHARTFWNEVYVYALRAAAIAIVGAVSAITVLYAYSIFYDREALLTDAFRCVNDALDASGLDHWVVNGTLLGAVRLKHFVLWDTEVDFALLLDRLTDVKPIIGHIQSSCSHLHIDRVTSTHDEVALTSDAVTQESTTPGSWQMCSGRVCVMLYEYLKAGEQLVSAYGFQAASTALPTARCTISGVSAMCPNDDEFFLSEAYGSNWKTERLTTLFK